MQDEDIVTYNRKVINEIFRWIEQPGECRTTHIREFVDEHCGTPILPEPNESLAVAFENPKTAALAYDRVYRIPWPSSALPSEIGFYCGSPWEITLWGVGLLALAGVNLGKWSDPFIAPEALTPAAAIRGLRYFCSHLEGPLGRSPTIVYDSGLNCSSDFPVGPQAILRAAISSIPLVDEHELSWAQILEFRKDNDVRRKYRAVVRWIDRELSTKATSAEEIEDLLATRLSDYSWALKKHGIKSSLGTISCLLDPKLIPSATVATAGLLGGSILASGIGLAFAIGQASVKIGTMMSDWVDERRKIHKDNYEIAYVHEVDKQFG